jgi:PAS domain S-box-containing protein
LSDKFPTNGQNVRKRVLWPIGITLVIFLVLFLVVFQGYLQRELTRKLDNHINYVARLYSDFLAERSATMQILIQQVQKNQILQQAMIRQDRDTLLNEATPLFHEFLQEQSITHFYFHKTDGINLLRVHKPERFGDQIDRITMRQAIGNNQISTGAELGPLGTFTLRVVVPWFFENQIIGYIEFGEEVEPLLKRMAGQTESQMALLVKKSLLDKSLWKEGQEMLGRSINWNSLPEHVVTATTENQLLEYVSRFASAPYFSGREMIEFPLQEQLYQGRYLPLADASEQEVGAMLIMYNTDETLNDHRTSIALVSVFCILLGGILFFSAYTILGRTEQNLKSARKKLLDEIEKTRLANEQLGQKVVETLAAEKALKEANDNLEQRVIDRTFQLDQQQQLLKKNLVEARKARDRISGIMRSVDDVLFVIDAHDNLLLMNESACNLLRVSQDEIIGEHASTAIWLGSLRDKVMETLRKRAGGILFDFEVSNSSQGPSLDMQVRSSALIDPQGEYEGMIFLARDVTRDRSMARLKSEFISVAAHELSTPLATILGFSELLYENNIPSESDRIDYAQIIYDKAESLSKLLEEMLDISRIESGRPLELHIETRLARELFLPTLEQYQKRVTDRQFNIELDEPELPLLADADKIAQVMENLLSNAVKYSEPASQISLCGQVTDEGYRLSVCDQGIGMTPEQISHAFEKFYRGDTANKAIKGTGLGLTITKNIVEEHQGKIWMENQTPKGTCVHFLLPVASQVEASPT